MIYKILYASAIEKKLKKIPKKEREKLLGAIESLSFDPRPAHCKKLKGKNGPLYRIRQGDYRVIYAIRDRELIILILALGHRKDIYDSLD